MAAFDCYALLNIPPDADENAIRKAWRLKTKDVHPDVNKSKDAAVEFMRLKEALDTLLDPVKRLQHDRQFGYYSKPKNQDANAKQQYSEFQKQKAETMVNAWNTDYEIAMKMREEQRRLVIEKHKRKVRRIVIAIVLLMVLVTGTLVVKSFL